MEISLTPIKLKEFNYKCTISKKKVFVTYENKFQINERMYLLILEFRLITKSIENSY